MSAPRRNLAASLLAPGARPLRFAGTGLAAAVLQLCVLAALTNHGWDALAANAVAFLLAAQLNFALSSLFTWRDRALAGSLPRRWLFFHGSIAATAGLNMLTFAAVHTILPTLLASLAGICVGAVGNYLAGDRLIFRSHNTNQPQERKQAA